MNAARSWLGEQLECGPLLTGRTFCRPTVFDSGIYSSTGAPLSALSYVISSFRCEVFEDCALQGYYATGHYSLPNSLEQRSSRFHTSLISNSKVESFLQIQGITECKNIVIYLKRCNSLLHSYRERVETFLVLSWGPFRLTNDRVREHIKEKKLWNPFALVEMLQSNILSENSKPLTDINKFKPWTGISMKLLNSKW